MARPKINLSILHQLEEACASLARFCDPGNDRCAVPAKHREVSRHYLDVWVLQRLEHAIEEIRNDKS
ncbi:hypothetical protein ACI2L4_25070 [Streptomyces sparsogenes]|uniref:hypothetical protein n=1 Tax=Streptomyces sparsogenes TaxID=67365 RepID=UPI00384BC594